MKKMIALTKQQYENQRIAAGDIFNVRDEHVVLLKALGRVKDMPAVKAMSTESNPELVPALARGGVGITPGQSGHTSPHIPSIEHIAEHVIAPKLEGYLITQTNLQPIEESVNESDKTEADAKTVQANEAVEVEQSIEYSRMLRERATALGIHVDGRWSDSRVQREIDEYNKRTYERMDMRPTE